MSTATATAKGRLPEAPRLYTPEQVAEYFGVCRTTVFNWVRDGEIPAPRRVGQRRYWTAEMLAGAVADRPAEETR